MKVTSFAIVYEMCGGIFWDRFCQLTEQPWSLTGNPLALFCFSLFILNLFLPVPKKHKHFIFCDHVMSAHGLGMAFKMLSLGIFLFPFVCINLCLPVHEKHDNFQGLNPTTTTSFFPFLL